MSAEPEGGIVGAVDVPPRVTDAERLARLALAAVVEPGSRALWQALQRAPATEVWAALRAGEQLGSWSPSAARISACQPERDLAALMAVGGRVVCPGDAEWPAGLAWPLDQLTGEVRDMAPPWVLLARGPHQVRQACVSSVSIVGARAATAYGTHVAKELAFALAEAGVSVVSGGAYGIDGAVHRGALSAEAAPTVAVLACGLDLAYPRGHSRLFDQIAATGLVLSEVAPGMTVTRMRFLVRNRLVAALSRGTVVVEAALRSGSASTASRAAELNKAVMAVPGPVTSSQSSGCHQLIRSEKAILVTDAADVLEVIGASGEHLLPPKRGAVHPRDGLQEAARRVLDAVPVRAPMGVARLAQAAGETSLTVQRVLPALLLAGLVEQRDGGWRLTTLGASK